MIEHAVDTIAQMLSQLDPQKGAAATLAAALTEKGSPRQNRKMIKELQKRRGSQEPSLEALLDMSHLVIPGIEDNLKKIAGALALIRADQSPAPSESTDSERRGAGEFYARPILEKLQALTELDYLEKYPDVLGSLQSLLRDPQNFIASTAYRASGVLLLMTENLSGGIGNNMNPFTLHTVTEEMRQFLSNDPSAGSAFLMMLDRYVKEKLTTPDQYERFADHLGEVMGRLPIELQEEFQRRDSLAALLRENQKRNLEGVSANQRLREAERETATWLNTLREIGRARDDSDAKAREFAAKIEYFLKQHETEAKFMSSGVTLDPYAHQMLLLLDLSLQPDTHPVVTTATFIPPDEFETKWILEVFANSVWSRLSESTQKELSLVSVILLSEVIKYQLDARGYLFGDEDETVDGAL